MKSPSPAPAKAPRTMREAWRASLPTYLAAQRPSCENEHIEDLLEDRDSLRYLHSQFEALRETLPVHRRDMSSFAFAATDNLDGWLMNAQADITHAIEQIDDVTSRREGAA